MSSGLTTDLGRTLSFHDTHSHTDPNITQSRASDTEFQNFRQSPSKDNLTEMGPIQSDDGYSGPAQVNSSSLVMDEQRNAAPVISAVPGTLEPQIQPQTIPIHESTAGEQSPLEPAVTAYNASSLDNRTTPPYSLSSSTVNHQSNQSGNGDPPSEKVGKLGEPDDKHVRTAGDLSAAGVEPAVAASYLAKGARREPRGWEDVEIEKKYHIHDPHIRGARTAALKVITFSLKSRFELY